MGPGKRTEANVNNDAKARQTKKCFEEFQSQRERAKVPLRKGA
jgi:hypothetical protein